MQYFITYVLGHQSDSGKKAELGTMVHKVMEVMADLKKFMQDNPKRKFLITDDDALGEVKIHKDKFMDASIRIEAEEILFHYNDASFWIKNKIRLYK